MWFDSHCHLHICEEEESVESVIERARAAGAGTMVTIGIDPESNARSVELATRHEGVHASVGVHPNDATLWDGDVAGQIEGFLTLPRVVGVGESGLDFYRDRAPRDVQEEVFRAHIDLATRYDKVLVIHTRESIDAALDVLENHGPPGRLVFHCWSGDAAQLHRALSLGAHISFAGNVSYKNADSLRAAARLVPTNRLLIETDAPFLTPEPHRGRRNEPAHVRYVGEAVAEARATEPETIAAATTATARALFSIA